MKMPTSSATMVRMAGNARCGAKLDSRSTEPTPSSSAAAARNARLKSSSALSDGFRGMADGIGRKRERRGGAPTPPGGHQAPRVFGGVGVLRWAAAPRGVYPQHY